MPRIREGRRVMVGANLISRCGIYCGACYVYRAFKDGGNFLDETSKKQGALKKEVRCGGCLGPVEDLWRNCRGCPVRPCLDKKGYVYCFECRDFEDDSCERYEGLSLFCGERGEDIRAAMERVRAGEAEAWLREQDEKWRCPACGGPTSWYEEACHHCGESLKV